MKATSQVIPGRDDIIEMVGHQMYGGRILNNSHRGHVVEVMVLAALGPSWKLVGLGWHPWDLQRGTGASRVRIQVKQCAWLQLWTPKTNKKDLRLSFGWKKAPPRYFVRDNPRESIESSGWFCDVFVFGLHLERDRKVADQVDPNQWRFLVIPVCDLEKELDTLSLKAAMDRWALVSWSGLAAAVDSAIKRLRKSAA